MNWVAKNIDFKELKHNEMSLNIFTIYFSLSIISLCCLLNSCVLRYMPGECVDNYKIIFIDTNVQSHYVTYARYDSVANNVIFDTCRWQNTTFRKKTISSILDKIEIALYRDSIADFFYDPCLDYTFLTLEDFEHNCWINSFRRFAILNLSDANLKKILSLGDVKKLKKKCKKKADKKITYRHKSTYELIVEEMKNRKARTRYAPYENMKRYWMKREYKKMMKKRGNTINTAKSNKDRKENKR